MRTRDLYLLLGPVAVVVVFAAVIFGIGRVSTVQRSDISAAPVATVSVNRTAALTSSASTTRLSVDFDRPTDAVERYAGGLGVGAPFIFLRDIAGNTIPPTSVQHALDGSAPPMTHTVTDKRDLSFTAKDHVMQTPYGSGGFQVIYNPLGSFIAGEGRATLSVDISTAGVAARKWVDLWLIPKGNLRTPAPGDPGYIDAVRDHPQEISVPADSLFLRPERFNGAVGWSGFPTGAGDRFGPQWEPIKVAESFTERTPHRIVINGRDLEFYVGGSDSQPLWTAQGVVPGSWAGREIEFGLEFVDYNSEKDGDPNTTWHWDNVLIEAQHVFLAPGAALPPAPTTPTATSSPNPTSTATATASATPSPSATATVVRTPTVTATIAPTASPTATSAPSATATASPPPSTATPRPPTATPTPTPVPPARPWWCRVFPFWCR